MFYGSAVKSICGTLQIKLHSTLEVKNHWARCEKVWPLHYLNIPPRLLGRAAAHKNDNCCACVFQIFAVLKEKSNEVLRQRERKKESGQ